MSDETDYCLDCDYFSNWFLIAAHRREHWEHWLHDTDQSELPPPDVARPLPTDFEPINMSFQGPILWMPDDAGRGCLRAVDADYLSPTYDDIGTHKEG